MMMSKPAPEKSEEREARPATTAPMKPADPVADLERRLAMLSDGDQTKPEPTLLAPPPDFATADSGQAAASGASSSVKGGKNALLARIMAAQERAKAVGPKPPPQDPPQQQESEQPPPSFDLLGGFEAPPPAFDDSLFGPAAPPPPFEESMIPPAPAPTFVFDPHAPAHNIMQAPPAPSAPDLEDLLQHETWSAPPPMKPNFQQELSTSAPDDAAVAAALGLEGLSEAEKQEILAEQAKILASIEQNKAASAISAADAFEQRSFSAAVRAVKPTNGGRTIDLGGGHVVPLAGAESTRQAIANGTAIKVQCLACENWMQVTEAAELMFCPTCQTVTPVLHESPESSQQVDADQALAERLQQEEYERAEREEARARQKKKEHSSTSATSPSAASGQSWLEWLGWSSSSDKTAAVGTPTTPPSFAQKPVQRGEIGVSRPPGNSSYESPRTETVSFEEGDSLLGVGGGGGGARMAQRQPLFSCVADSITTAATSLSTALTATTLSEDAEGNVHGVDASSLLAVSTAGRESNQQYERLDQKQGEW